MTTRVFKFLMGCLAVAWAIAAPIAGGRTLQISKKPDLRCTTQFPDTTTIALETTKRPDHVVVAAQSLKRLEAERLTGPCVGEIQNFILGQIILSSGDTFYITKSGLRRDPERRTPNRAGPAGLHLAQLAGYQLLMSDRVTGSSVGRNAWNSYVGLFKSPSDYVVATFAIVNGTPSGKAEILIRSSKPITAIDYFPDPDTLSGRLGLVERGPGVAKLYEYGWNHGSLSDLTLTRSKLPVPPVDLAPAIDTPDGRIGFVQRAAGARLGYIRSIGMANSGP